MRIDKKVKRVSHQESEFSPQPQTNHHLKRLKKPLETLFKENHYNINSPTRQSTLNNTSCDYRHLNDISTKKISKEIVSASNRLANTKKSTKKQMGLSRSITLSPSTLTLRCENTKSVERVRPRQSKLVAIHSIIKAKRLSLNVQSLNRNDDDDAENQPYLNCSMNKSFDLMKLVTFERSKSAPQNNNHKRRRSLNIHNCQHLFIDESSNNSTGSTLSDLSSLNAHTLNFSNINLNVNQPQIPNNKTNEPNETWNRKVELKPSSQETQQIKIENAELTSNTNGAKIQQDNQVVVPKWRKTKPLPKLYKLEGCENMTNEIYLKRHQKLENEEIKIKKWDMRRQREELERNKLLRRDKSTTSDVNMKQDSNNISFETSQLKELPIKFKCPDELELDEIEMIQIVNEDELKNVDITTTQHDQRSIPKEEENKPKIASKKRSTNNKTVIGVVMENSNASTVENDLDKTILNSTMPVMTTYRSKRKSIQPTNQSKRKRTSK